MKIKQLLLIICFLLQVPLMAQTVKWFAGKQNDVDPNLNYNNSNNIAPADAYFYYPEGICWDKNGNMWITERNKIRLFYNGTFHNRAGGFGDGDQSQSYVNATGIQSRFYAPTSIASDDNGVLYIADDENHAIRKMDAFTTIGNGQVVSTFAGALPNASKFGVPGSTNGTGTNASFYNPKGIVRDANGNFYVTEFNNFTIRKITPSGSVSTLAGNVTVQGTKDGVGTAAEFGGPYGIAIFDNNYVVISDKDNGTIRKVHMTTGAVTTICGDPTDIRYQDGTLAQARFREPRGLAVVDGKIYVNDYSVIRVIDINANKVSTYAGSQSATGNQDGDGSNARFGVLSGMAYDGKITLYITDVYYNVIKTVTINDLAPKANFAANKTAAIVDEIITISNTSTGKPATSQTWAVTSSGLSHTVVSGTLSSPSIGVKFHVAGFYHVKLNVTNQYGSDSLYKGSYISVSTTGIQVVPEDVSVGVYPNPSQGEFTLQSLYGSYPIQDYRITDLTGRLILQRSGMNSLKESFDLSNSPAGFYFIRVRTTAGENTLKLQKI